MHSLVAATCELQWILNMLHDMQIMCVKPPVLCCDNQSVFHIAVNLVFYGGTKHLDIDCHLVIAVNLFL
jgi:hypothetical protein